MKVKKKVKNQNYFCYTVWRFMPSNDETEAENDAIEIMINDWFAKSKKVEFNGIYAEINAEILYFEQPIENEENTYRGVA